MKDLNPLRLCALTITFSSTLAAAVQTPPTCRQPAPWRRFTNQLVSYIWGEEQTHRKCDYRPGTQNGRTDSSSPQNAFLNARYGQDMVLRFNVSTVEETTAIAEAAEDLYLDIWEFSDNWVDIRLAKDIVSRVAAVVLLCMISNLVTSCLRSSAFSQLHYRAHMPLSYPTPL